MAPQTGAAALGSTPEASVATVRAPGRRPSPPPSPPTLDANCLAGGLGSVFPPVCDYGSQNSLCGPRPDVGNGAVIGEDSCESSRNGVCEDGGDGSSFMADSQNQEVSICKFATE